MKVMCFFLPICTVKLIKFELKLNLIYMCNVIVQSHSVNEIHSLFQSHTIYCINFLTICEVRNDKERELSLSFDHCFKSTM